MAVVLHEPSAAQRNLRHYAEDLANDPFRRMNTGQALADLIRGHDVSRPVEAGVEDTARRWGMPVVELRELMAELGAREVPS